MKPATVDPAQGRRLGAVFAFGLALLWNPLPAEAQEDRDPETVLDEVVVTGSLIRRTNLEISTPVTQVDADDLFSAGTPNLGNLLNDLPAFTSTFSTGNSSRFIGTAGLNALDLRGLGTTRTLVLVDGKRHVSGSAGSARVDVNSIPIDLIERVEVITGGASATYGADAVTGVVNFIMKDDFEGIRLRSQYGFAEEGPFERSSISLIAGANFADNRGNVAFAAEYDRQNEMFSSDRDHLSQNLRLVDNPADGDAPGVNDGIPDQIWVSNAGFSTYGPGFGATGITFDPDPLVDGDERSDRLVFDPSGQIRPQEFGTDYGRNECSDCDFFDTTSVSQLQPELERWSVSTFAHFDLTDNVRLYGDVKFVNVDTVSNSTSGPFDTPNSPILIFEDNAYIDQAPGLRAIFDNPNYLLPTVAADDPRVAQRGLEYIPVRRINNEFVRGENNERQTFRTVMGLEGQLGNWSYDVSANYGRTTTTLLSINNRINDRFFAATDAVDDGNGNIVCRVSVDPDAALYTGDAPTGVVDPGACVPTSVFGRGALNAESAAYWNAGSTTSRAVIEQVVYTAIVSHTDLFELPGGDVGFAFGLERREERSTDRPDALAATGATFLNALQVERGKFDVNEAFAEFYLPVLGDLPLIEQLDVELAARHADYSTSGSNTTWKVGLIWSPLQDLRIRSTVSEAIRAPDIGSLFGPQNQNFFTRRDPCEAARIQDARTTPEIRQANCNALGIPTGWISPVSFSVEGLSGGNPELQPETSDSFTIGFVYQPSWFEGFDITVDYWDIEITDAIGTPGADNITNRCVDDPNGIDNEFCALITRATGTFELTFIRNLTANLQKLTANGYDVQMTYARDIAGNPFRARLVASLREEDLFFPFQSDPDQTERNHGLAERPELAYNLSLSYQLSKWRMNWETRFIESGSRFAFETLANNPDISSEINTGDIFYHDINTSYFFNDTWELFAGIDNLFDEDAPIGFTGRGEVSGNYDNIGRFGYIGFRADFM
ncbi:MAG: TonB-dependent receptor [Pseudomonadota bacterium]